MTCTILTSTEFIDHLETNGDFRPFGTYRTTEFVRIGDIKLKHDVFLGEGSFEKNVHCDSAQFKEFHCNTTHFDHFFAGSAQFASFNSDHAVFEVYHSDTASYETFFGDNAKFHKFFASKSTFDCFHGNEATFWEMMCNAGTFGHFYCDKADVKEFHCNEALFVDTIHAQDNYALGMVIHHYKTSGTHFALHAFQKPQRRPWYERLFQ